MLVCPTTVIALVVLHSVPEVYWPLQLTNEYNELTGAYVQIPSTCVPLGTLVELVAG